MIDLEADKEGKMVFALSPGDGSAGTGAKVAVFDVSGGNGSVKEVGNFEVGGGVGGGSAMGMAIF